MGVNDEVLAALCGGATDLSLVALSLPELFDGGPRRLDGPHPGCRAAVYATCQTALPTLVELAWSGNLRPPDALDPLVATLIRLMEEGAAVSPEAVATPLLVFALESAHALEGGRGEPFTRLSRARPAPRVVASLSAALEARIQLAVSRVAAAGRRIPAFVSFLAEQRLLYLYRPEDIDPRPDLVELGTVIGRPGLEAVMALSPGLLRDAVAGVVDRRANARLTGEDQMLLASRPTLGIQDYLAPEVASLILANPARFLHVPSLLRAGHEPETMSALLSRASMVDVVETLWAIRRLRMLGGLLSALDVRSSVPLQVPRGTVGKVAVVALGLGRLRAASSRGVENAASARYDRAWADVLGDDGVDLGFVGLRFYADLGQAFRAMLTVASTVGARAGVPRSALAFGPVGGGLCADRMHAYGAAVDAAVRHAVGGDHKLVVDVATVDPLFAALRRAGVEIDVVPGGLGVLPPHLGVERAFTLDGAVLIFRKIEGGFAVEVHTMESWLALAGLDDLARVLPESQVSSVLPSASGVGPASRRAGIAQALHGAASRVREGNEPTWYLPGPEHANDSFDPVFELEVSDEEEPVVESESGIFADPEPGTRPRVERVLAALDGYVCVMTPEAVFFGRREGDRLSDLHRYAPGQMEAIYLRFLLDKATTGFVPRPHRTGDIGDGTLLPLDLDRIDRVWGRLF